MGSRGERCGETHDARSSPISFSIRVSTSVMRDSRTLISSRIRPCPTLARQRRMILIPAL